MPESRPEMCHVAGSFKGALLKGKLLLFYKKTLLVFLTYMLETNSNKSRLVAEVNSGPCQSNPNHHRSMQPINKLSDWPPAFSACC